MRRVPDHLARLEGERVKPAAHPRIEQESGAAGRLACAMTSSPTSGDLQIISRIAVFCGLRRETVAHFIAGAVAGY